MTGWPLISNTAWYLTSMANQLFHILFRLTTMKTPKLCITGPLWGESTSDQWIPSPDSKVHGANMGPTLVLSAPDGPHVGPMNLAIWPHFYQTRSAWSMDQGSNKNHSPVNNCAPTVTKFCVMWEGQALPHDTKFSNCRDKIVDSRAFLSWSLIHGSSWSGLIKLGPGSQRANNI